MSNLIVKLRKTRSLKIDMALCAAVFAIFVLGCGSGAPKKPIPANYVGTWTGQDGTKIAIRSDNTGDYNAGSTKVDGAAVEVDEAARTIQFTMLGASVGKYTIDSPAAGDTMKLSGTTFKRAGGSTSSGTDASKPASSANSSAADDDADSNSGSNSK